MLKSKDFWIGLIAGLVLYFVYANYMKGKSFGG